MSKFYSYLWLREDGTPYYAGKGYGNRAFKHLKPPYPPRDKSRIVVFERNSEQEAFETEIELIRNWGRKDLGTGCLLNLTDGGDGHSGYVPTAEHREKVRAKSMGNSHGRLTAGHQGVKNNQFFAGHTHTDDEKARISESLRGNTHLLGHIQSPETKIRISRGNRGKIRTPEMRQHYVHSWTSERRARRAEETRARMEQNFIKTVAWG